MGLRGPAKTPTRILALRGSRRASRPGEPQPEVELPPVPDWLGDDAKKAYAAMGERLLALGLMTAIDGNALARYATLWIRWRRCEEFVAKHGEVYVVRAKPAWDKTEGAPIGFKAYPQSKLALALATELLRLEREFGMTPAARARLSSDVPVDDDAGEATSFDYFGSGAKTG